MKSDVHVPGLDDPSPLEIALMRARVTARVLKEPAPHQQIGDFTLLHRLGAGATGTVYEARSRLTGAEVAIKLLRTHHSRAVQRFKTEFRSLTHVAHPNLVQLYELFCDLSEWYFTMELVRGANFTAHVRGPLACERAAQLARLRASLGQMLSAVQAIHAHGKLHCDLKPANVLVSELGRVVVLDFGLTTALSDHPSSESGRRPGTPAYMAPELRAGHAAPSVASDAYSIGVMLFEALTGTLPFYAETGVEAARASARAPRASDLIADTPADLDELCARLLAHEPQDRVSIDEALTLVRWSANPLRAALPREKGTPWVGRRAELDTLHGAFTQLSRGAPVAVFVKGQSGIGKSALLGRFEAELGSRATVIRAVCYEHESVPYKAFDGLVDALPAQLARLSTHILRAVAASESEALLRVFPQLQSVSELRQRATAARSSLSQQELRRQAFAALKTLLRCLAEVAPLVLMVDDLQWADLDSAQLLLELLGPPHAPAMLYIGCYRDGEEESSEFLSMFNARDRESRLLCESLSMTLQPLEKTAAVAMARALLGRSHHADPIYERIAREAAGVPLFVAELAAYLASDFQVDSASPSLSVLLARRLAGLGSTERQALSLVAVAARPLSRQLLDCALGGGPSVARALHVLSARALLITNAQGRLVIYHDRLREHLSEQLTPSEAAAQHQRLAQAYDGLQLGEPEWLIDHWRAAGDDARARTCAIAAAELAVRKLAFHRGAALYATAIAIPSTDGPLVSELSAALGDVLVNAGRGVEAAEAYLEAARGALPESAFAWRCRATQQFLRSGHKTRGIVLLRQLLEETGSRYPETIPAIGVKWLLSRGRLALRQRFGARAVPERDVDSQRRLQVLGAVFRECAVVDPLRGLLFQSQFLEQALRTGDRESVFIGFAWDAYNQAFLRNATRSKSMAPRLEQLDRLAAELATPYAAATTAFVRAAVSLSDGRYVEAAKESARGGQIFRDQCLGAVWEETFCTLVYTAALDNVGPLTELCHASPGLVRRANERADQLSDRLLSTPMATALLAQDQPVEAEAFLRQRQSQLSDELDIQRLGIVLKMTDTLTYVGDGPGAQRTIESAWTSYLKSGLDRTFMRMFVRMRRAHAALVSSLARPSEALRRAALSEAAKIERMRRDDATVIAQGIRAAVAFQRGDREEAQERLREAVALTEPMGVTVTTHCYRLQLGYVSASPQGSQLVASAESALRTQGIVNPARFARIYVSGIR